VALLLLLLYVVYLLRVQFFSLFQHHCRHSGAPHGLPLLLREAAALGLLSARSAAPAAAAAVYLLWSIDFSVWHMSACHDDRAVSEHSTLAIKSDEV